ncbi:Phosphopantetheine attachment site [Streptomyces sp. 2224.1]|uniref:phosphopantetheine-binding protein n=1 Tax=unclassified Streptomyces TaxID=2593676 RepID=UPI00088C5393|nr:MULTISPECIES: phosphopantetheine-binding protein [unclassified Streptomyces]PBC84317.1 phosphopantetheine binding protein [Streptomyces sp. 2321.6]SDR32427.1 Phosphopantetheine attachment site [Streptomyces sp. KS_16]SEB75670.1 Phosphopantetheine attachment site [Streptomyces sp. 2224.1]SED27124.1 Phosphopantetheine attachment site [Streptomyces sp. 2133.1]SEE56328.1 Phosphopantetheine attachment site [Streptomyces sp. 2112.3]
MTEDSVLKAVLAAVREVAPGAEISDDTALIAQRVIDSLSLLSLVSLLEKEFSVTIRDSEILPAHFESPLAVRAFLKSKGC